ncbi:MAG: ABC transporter ATP-binding protein [Deltaproteobacteria bacterium]|nr:ABC transporter ATP-binding protein [Deltaproteobacteria bacterium]
MPLIQLKDVHKEYLLGENVVHALKGVDMSVEKGEFTVVTGPSGSGKSTLLNIIGCLDRLTRGSYKLEDQEVGQTDFDELADVRNHKIGFIFQSFNLIPVLDVLENVEFPCLIRSKPEPRKVIRERARQVAEDVGLGSVVHHRPDQLSGGQRQRVAIARALVTHPSLVLADEPTANLDSVTSNQIIDLMLKLNADKGVTFLFSTHDPRVTKHARRVLSISDGKVSEGANDSH